MARWAALTLVIIGVLVATSAHAQESDKRVSFRWNAPRECPDDAAALAAVVELLGQPLSEAREQELAVSVSVQAAADGFSAHLVFVSPQGTQERGLEHPSCDKLMEAAALLAALAIDPERVRARQAAAEAAKEQPATVAAPVTAPLPSAAPPVPVQQACPPSSPPRAAPSPEPAWRHSVGMAGFAGAGVVPGLGGGLATELGIRFHSFHARLSARYWLPTSADIQNGPLSIELSLATLGLHACTGPRGDWSILGCLGANLGDMSGSGQGLNHAHTRHALFGALEAGVLTAYSRVQPAPFAGLGLSLATFRPRFGASLAGVETETFKPSPVAVVGYLGMSYGL